MAYTSNTAVNADDTLLCARVLDMVKRAQQGYYCKTTLFLDEHQQAVCLQTLRSERADGFRFYGGYEQAKRKMLGIASDIDLLQDTIFPMQAVTFSFRKQDRLSHRDFLGALMALSIKREVLGDLIVSPGSAVVFCASNVLPLIMQLEKIGKVGVTTNVGLATNFTFEQTFLELRGTVASLRLDCIIAMVCKLSREKAANLIRTGCVMVNHIPQTSISVILQSEDVFSVRGYGKFILCAEMKSTKKGNLFISIKKYL